MKFIELANNNTLENKIEFQKQMISILEEDIQKNGDNGFGLKKKQLENMKSDLQKLQDGHKRIN